MLRLNIGCGDYPLLGWTNLDAAVTSRADVIERVPPIPYMNHTVDDLYAGHFLEHLPRPEATAFLAECWRVLRPGGRLGVLVPDTREIMTRWLAGAPDIIEYPEGQWHPIADLEFICSMFVYGTNQDSHHRWSYDIGTLGQAMTAAGFGALQEIDRYHDPRLATGRWFQCGLDGFRG